MRPIRTEIHSRTSKDGGFDLGAARPDVRPWPRTRLINRRHEDPLACPTWSSGTAMKKIDLIHREKSSMRGSWTRPGKCPQCFSGLDSPLTKKLSMDTACPQNRRHVLGPSPAREVEWPTVWAGRQQWAGWVGVLEVNKVGVLRPRSSSVPSMIWHDVESRSATAIRLRRFGCFLESRMTSIAVARPDGLAIIRKMRAIACSGLTRPSATRATSRPARGAD